MTSKGFSVKIYFDLHIINCPGVWLCPNGCVALRINTLNSHIESRKLSPIFPIIFNEKFLFKKTFIEVCTLAQLECCLEDEYLYAELIQWPTIGCKGVILATFETNLMDLLYPAPCLKGLLPGIDVDLLMEPSKYFPGIIAPKIEISTRTAIEQVEVCELNTNGAHIINPKLINSKGRPCIHRKRPSEGGIIRQKRVCHTQGIPKSPMNRCTHHLNYCNDELLVPCSSGRQTEIHIDQCYQKSRRRLKCYTPSRYQQINDNYNSEQLLHDFDDCAVCLKYRSYFSKNSLSQDTFREQSSNDSRREATYGVCDVTNCSNHEASDK
ncbi:hypothetical protein PV327_004347 [Microctonus hyperodae]|uniref:Spermatogenesis-associated protein 6 N-terminal domain-containing protein n=1 Tax=Microctonus hyperodae TaxID=165561 RepID=A0AA39FCD2_MICHY|nr:hypothetical protein PV327_004347 [Microctonus hyperodae]